MKTKTRNRDTADGYPTDEQLAEAFRRMPAKERMERLVKAIEWMKSQPDESEEPIHHALTRRIDRMSTSHRAMTLLMLDDIESTKAKPWVVAAARARAKAK